MKYLKIFVSAVLGGICIGIGGTVFITLENKVLASLFFTVGLFSICTLGLNLYTGKVCYVFQNGREYAVNLLVIWFGNLVGTGLASVPVRYSRIGAALVEKAAAMCAVRVNDSNISLFMLGIICNILIYIAVEGYNRNPHEIGKYLSIFFGVMVFLLCGTEHCVADMYYFWLAGAWSGRAIVALIIITLGNSFGGVIFPVARAWIMKQ